MISPEAETRLLELAQAHAAWGCPKLHRQLRHEGHRINHKRTERLYRQHGLSIRRRRRRRLVREVRNPLLQPIRPGQCWSMDFMGDSLADGRAYRTFNVIDDYARDALVIEIDISLTAQRVVRVLDRLCEWHGAPESIRSERKACPRGTTAPSSDPTYCRSGRMPRASAGTSSNRAVRRKTATSSASTAPTGLRVLDANQFRSLDEARAVTEEWLAIYNEQRTHSAIGHLPPLAFKRRWQQRQFPEKSGLG